jgi:hypothetical protein
MFHAGFLHGLLLNSEDGGDIIPNPRLTFNGLHGAVIQKMKLFKIYNIKIYLHNFGFDLYYYYN